MNDKGVMMDRQDQDLQLDPTPNEPSSENPLRNSTLPLDPNYNQSFLSKLAKKSELGVESTNNFSRSDYKEAIPNSDLKSSMPAMANLNSLRVSTELRDPNYAQIRSRIFDYNERQMGSTNKRTGGFTTKKQQATVDRLANQTGNFVLGRISPLGVFQKSPQQTRVAGPSWYRRQQEYHLKDSLNLQGRKIGQHKQSPIFQENQTQRGSLDLNPNDLFANRVKTIAENIIAQSATIQADKNSSKSSYRRQVDEYNLLKQATQDKSSIFQQIKVMGANPLAQLSHTSSIETLRGARSLISKTSALQRSLAKHKTIEQEDSSISPRYLDDYTTGSKGDMLSPPKRINFRKESGSSKKGHQKFDLQFVIQNRQRKLRKYMPRSHNSPSSLAKDEGKNLNVDIKDELSPAQKKRTSRKSNEKSHDLPRDKSYDSSKKPTSQDYESTESLAQNKDILYHFKNLQQQLNSIKDQVQNVLKMQEATLSQHLEKSSDNGVTELTLSQKKRLQQSLLQRYHQDSSSSIKMKQGGSNAYSTQFLPSLIAQPKVEAKAGSNERPNGNPVNSQKKIKPSPSEFFELQKVENTAPENSSRQNQLEVNDTGREAHNTLELEPGQGTALVDSESLMKAGGLMAAVNQPSLPSISPNLNSLDSQSNSSPERESSHPKEDKNMFSSQQQPQKTNLKELKKLPASQQNKVVSQLTKTFTFLLDLNQKNNNMKQQVFTFIQQLRANLNQIHIDSSRGRLSSKGSNLLNQIEIEKMSKDLIEQLFQIQVQSDLLEQVLNLNTLISINTTNRLIRPPEPSPPKPVRQRIVPVQPRRESMAGRLSDKKASMITSGQEELYVTGQQFSPKFTETKSSKLRDTAKQAAPEEKRASIADSKEQNFIISPSFPEAGQTRNSMPSSFKSHNFKLQGRNPSLGVTEVSFKVEQSQKKEEEKIDTQPSIPELDFNDYQMMMTSSKLFDSYDNLKALEQDFNASSQALTILPDQLPEPLIDIHPQQLTEINREINSKSVLLEKERGIRFLTKELLESISHKPFLKSKPYVQRQLGWSKVRFENKLEEVRKCLNARYDKFGPSEKVRQDFEKLFKIPEKPKKERVDSLAELNLKAMASSESIYEDLMGDYFGKPQLLPQDPKTKAFHLSPDVVIKKFKHLDSKDFITGMSKFSSRERSNPQLNPQLNEASNEDTLNQRSDEGAKEDGIVLMADEKERYESFVQSLNKPQHSQVNLVSQMLGSLNYNYGTSSVDATRGVAKHPIVQTFRPGAIGKGLRSNTLHQSIDQPVKLPKIEGATKEMKSPSGAISRKSPTSLRRTRNLASELKTVFQGTQQKFGQNQIFTSFNSDLSRMEDELKGIKDFDFKANKDLMLTGSTLKVNHLSPPPPVIKEQLQARQELPILTQMQKVEKIKGGLAREAQFLRVTGSRKEHSSSTQQSPLDTNSLSGRPPHHPKAVPASLNKQNSNMRIQITNTTTTGQVQVVDDSIQKNKIQTSNQSPHYLAPLNQSPRNRKGKGVTKSVMDKLPKKKLRNGKRYEDSGSQINFEEFDLLKGAKPKEAANFVGTPTEELDESASKPGKKTGQKRRNQIIYNSYAHHLEGSAASSVKQNAQALREDLGSQTKEITGNKDNEEDTFQNHVSMDLRQNKRLNTEVDDQSIQSPAKIDGSPDEEGPSRILNPVKEPERIAPPRIHSELAQQQPVTASPSGKNNNSTLYEQDKTSKTSGVPPFQKQNSGQNEIEFNRSFQKPGFQPLLLQKPKGERSSPYETVVVLQPDRKDGSTEKNDSNNFSSSPITVGGVMFQNNMTNYPMQSRLLGTQYPSQKISDRQQNQGTIHNSGHSLLSSSEAQGLQQPSLPGQPVIAALSPGKAFDISQTQVLTPSEVPPQPPIKLMRDASNLNQDLVSQQFGIGGEKSAAFSFPMQQVLQNRSILSNSKHNLNVIQQHLSQIQEQSMLFNLVQNHHQQQQPFLKHSPLSPVGAKIKAGRKMHTLNASVDYSSGTKKVLSPIVNSKKVLNRDRKPTQFSSILQVNSITSSDRNSKLRNQENIFVRKEKPAPPKKPNQISFKIPDQNLNQSQDLKFYLLTDNSVGSTPGTIKHQPPLANIVSHGSREPTYRKNSKASYGMRSSIIRSSIHSKISGPIQETEADQKLNELMGQAEEARVKMSSKLEKTKYQSYLD